ncbi:DUF2357 domain-containing protein [Enterococcus casseliflavus]|uniref:DUF2357 domain-containing protein n=1 Tax=Enterococcus casseliflavus TaxID=37734 RepID=UPI0035E27C0E
MGLPFKVQLLTKGYDSLLNFYSIDEAIDFKSKTIPKIKEFQELKFIFSSTNIEDRLYLKEIDDFEIDGRFEDENKNLYFPPSNRTISIFDYDSNQNVPLIPGYYYFEIISCNQIFYSVIQIIPKDLTLGEWHVMREEIEESVKGLSTEFIKRKESTIKDSFNSGQKTASMIEKIEKLCEDIPKVLVALDSLKKEAKFFIAKEYSWKPNGSKTLIDMRTLQMMQRHPEKKGQIYSPKRILEYDIPENQWIKFILNHFIRFTKLAIDYIERIHQLLDDENETVEKFNHSKPTKTVAYTYNRLLSQKESLDEDKNRLRSFYIYISEFLEAKYFSNVSDRHPKFVPKSLILSPKYNAVYKMYLNNIRNNDNVHFDRNYRYYWKKTDLLYEIWTYIKTVNALIDLEFEPVSGWIFDCYSYNEALPFLTDGTKVVMKRGTVEIRVLFNETLRNKSFNNTLDNPIKTYSSRNKPDIRIDIFDSSSYTGSIILDAKYKRLYNIVSSSRSRSQIDQLMAYRNDTSSNIIDFNDILLRQLRVVQAVFAIYPLRDGNTSAPKFYDNDNLIFSELRPNFGYEDFRNSLKKQIEDRIAIHESLSK